MVGESHGSCVERYGVHVKLELGEGAANNADELWRQVVREQRVGAPEDELIAELTKLNPLGIAFGSVLLARPRLSSSQDRILVDLMKILLGAEQPRVGKVHHRIELIEVILNGSAREEDASAGLQARERDRRLRVLVLQPMRLVTDEEAALVALLEDRLVQAEGLVRDDQDRTTAVHEACDQRRTRNDSERGLESSVGWSPACAHA